MHITSAHTSRSQVAPATSPEDLQQGEQAKVKKELDKAQYKQDVNTVNPNQIGWKNTYEYKVAMYNPATIIAVGAAGIAACTVSLNLALAIALVNCCRKNSSQIGYNKAAIYGVMATLPLHVPIIVSICLGGKVGQCMDRGLFGPNREHKDALSKILAYYRLLGPNSPQRVQ